MRSGYQANFLDSNTDINLPQPSLAISDDILQPPGLLDGEIVVPYIHYSLIMSKSTKQALYSAANIDIEHEEKVPSKKGRKWFVDPRIGKENQITNSAYKHSPWDRGHLTRRTAVTWGDASLALAASNDSCSYANASMQHSNFNEDEWRLPERTVAKFKRAKDKKLTVMTGPIFSTCDRFFTKGLGFEPVRIPSGFWKTLTYIHNQTGKLVTNAYIFFQDIDAIKTERNESRTNLKYFAVTTSELQLWTGLEFDKAMFNSNELKFYSGPEVIEVNLNSELSDESEAILSAGIVDESSIHEARNHIDLEVLYELVEKISWY
jgi:endonuclease G